MTASYKDNLAEFNRRLRGATAQGLIRAAIFTHTKCRAAVGISARGVYRHRIRDTSARSGGPIGSQYTSYLREHGADPSEPGESPHKRTGLGQSAIVWEFNGNTRDPAVRVGVTEAGIHMIFLELGTQYIEPRPWLLKTVLDNLRQIAVLALPRM